MFLHNSKRSKNFLNYLCGREHLNVLVLTCCALCGCVAWYGVYWLYESSVPLMLVVVLTPFLPILVLKPLPPSDTLDIP